ncbi:MAG TPA: hypothetical protein VD931_16500, partial [Baekduia sp.]|nr:hypothetical protein [Baekduia sp.]
CAVLAAAAATPVVDPEERAAALLGAAPLPAAVIAVEGTRTGKPGLGVHAGTGEPGSGVHGCVDAAEGRWLVVADADGAMDLAARIAADVEGTAGVAVRREAGEDPLQLVGLADERMFAARAAGVLVR